MANDLREEQVRRDVARSPEECVRAALALGREAIVAYATAHGVARARARAFIEAMRAAGPAMMESA